MPTSDIRVHRAQVGSGWSTDIHALVRGFKTVKYHAVSRETTEHMDTYSV